MSNLRIHIRFLYFGESIYKKNRRYLGKGGRKEPIEECNQPNSFFLLSTWNGEKNSSPWNMATCAAHCYPSTVDRSEDWLALAHTAHRLQLKRHALYFLHKYSRWHKNDLPTALQQARLNAEIGESRKSLHVLSRYIRHVPSDMFVAKFLVLMLRTVGRVKDSAIVLARAIAANIREGYRPDPESFVELGTIYYEGELYQESVMCVDLLKAVLDIRKFKDPPPRFPYPSAPQESLDNNDEEGASLSEESPSLREEEVRSILLFISQQIVESEASADEEELARFFRSGERGEQHPHQEKVLSFSSSGPLFSTNRVATGELQQQHKEKMRLSLKMICEELLRAPSVKDDLSSLCHLLFTPTSSNSKSSIPFLVNESTFNRESPSLCQIEPNSQQSQDESNSQESQVESNSQEQNQQNSFDPQCSFNHFGWDLLPPPALLLRGKSLVRLGRVDDAIRTSFHPILHCDVEQHASLIFAVGEEFRRLLTPADLLRARAVYLYLLQKGQVWLGVLVSLGIVSKLLGCMDDAMLYLGCVLQFVPAQAAATFHMAHMYQMSQRLDDALSVLKTHLNSLKENLHQKESVWISRFLRRLEARESEKRELKMGGTEERELEVREAGERDSSGRGGVQSLPWLSVGSNSIREEGGERKEGGEIIESSNGGVRRRGEGPTNSEVRAKGRKGGRRAGIENMKAYSIVDQMEKESLEKVGDELEKQLSSIQEKEQESVEKILKEGSRKNEVEDPLVVGEEEELFRSNHSDTMYMQRSLRQDESGRERGGQRETRKKRKRSAHWESGYDEKEREKSRGVELQEKRGEKEKTQKKRKEGQGRKKEGKKKRKRFCTQQKNEEGEKKKRDEEGVREKEERKGGGEEREYREGFPENQEDENEVIIKWWGKGEEGGIASGSSSEGDEQEERATEDVRDNEDFVSLRFFHGMARRRSIYDAFVEAKAASCFLLYDLKMVKEFQDDTLSLFLDDPFVGRGWRESRSWCAVCANKRSRRSVPSERVWKVLLREKEYFQALIRCAFDPSDRGRVKRKKGRGFCHSTIPPVHSCTNSHIASSDENNVNDDKTTHSSSIFSPTQKRNMNRSHTQSDQHDFHDFHENHLDNSENEKRVSLKEKKRRKKERWQERICVPSTNKSDLTMLDAKQHRLSLSSSTGKRREATREYLRRRSLKTYRVLMKYPSLFTTLGEQRTLQLIDRLVCSLIASDDVDKLTKVVVILEGILFRIQIRDHQITIRLFYLCGCIWLRLSEKERCSERLRACLLSEFEQAFWFAFYQSSPEHTVYKIAKNRAISRYASL